METTWIVIANAQHARFFQRVGPNEDWEVLFDREPQMREALEAEPNVPDAEARSFARELAQMLERSIRGYERLVIAAPPHFLQLLNRELSPPVSERVDVMLDTERTRAHLQQPIDLP